MERNRATRTQVKRRYWTNWTQGPKGDTPDISNLVTKTQHTNDLNKRLIKQLSMLLGNIFLIMELLFISKSQIQLLHAMSKVF